MSNILIIALNEYINLKTVGAYEIMKKYDITPSEFWAGYAQLKASAPK